MTLEFDSEGDGGVSVIEPTDQNQAESEFAGSRELGRWEYQCVLRSRRRTARATAVPRTSTWRFRQVAGGARA